MFEEDSPDICMWSCKYSDRVSCSKIFEECVGWRRLMLYKVVSRFDSSILICYLQLAHQLSYQAFLPRLPSAQFIFQPPPTFRYLVPSPGNIDVNCHPGSVCIVPMLVCVHCLPIPAASPPGVKGVMMALFTQLGVQQSLAKL